MCALHPGQFVDVAASLTSCLRLHSKQATTRLPRRFQRPSSFLKGPCAPAVCSFSPSFKPGLGADGLKLRPHCRQIVLLAAAYSICLKPQCGHSTLALAGDLITRSLGGRV